jgi:hypothetical protein
MMEYQTDGARELISQLNNLSDSIGEEFSALPDDNDGRDIEEEYMERATAIARAALRR